MDIIPFIQFTLNGQYISRWVYGGILMYIPVLNFFSLGFLSKSSRLLMIGTIGLPTWQNRYDIWIEGIKLLFIFILYEAIPFFLFSCGFFLTTLSSITAFFGHIIMKLSYLALLVFSFFLPFAMATFAEQMDFRKALEFEKVLSAIKEVFVPYLGGYVATLIALYICKLFIRIPFFVGFIISSILTYYVLLLATYYFTQLFKRTSLALEKAGDLAGEPGAGL
jgi:hypothetical protein